MLGKWRKPVLIGIDNALVRFSPQVAYRLRFGSGYNPAADRKKSGRTPVLSDTTYEKIPEMKLAPYRYRLGKLWANEKQRMFYLRLIIILLQ